MPNENEFLPEPLPSEPFALFKDWFDTAWQRRLQPNANAMVLATIDTQGNPTARIVLCKQVVAASGYIVFFTNYQSHKGRELSEHPNAAAVFHWDALHRQVRMTGRVVKSPAAESDAYFAERAIASRVGAWASKQSEPLASRAQLAHQVREIEKRFGVTSDTKTIEIPRPQHWGGYRLWPETLELWIEGPGRIHDRAVWTRKLKSRDEFSFDGSAWEATRLNP